MISSLNLPLCIYTHDFINLVPLPNIMKASFHGCILTTVSHESQLENIPNKIRGEGPIYRQGIAGMWNIHAHYMKALHNKM
jgi:hypothetical protein